MIKKYSVLIGVVISLILMIIAISIYPGGSMFDKNSVHLPMQYFTLTCKKKYLKKMSPIF